MSGGAPAVFLDRDGTLIEDAHYLADPERVALLPGAAEAVRRLNARGVRVVVVTNQSGIGRGLVSREAYERVRARLEELLAREGARLDATYHCPHHPDDGCECRKPGVALFRQAASDLGVDLSRSALVGDRWRDVAPARALGGRGILVPSPETPAEDVERARREAEVAPTLAEAVDRVLLAQYHPAP